MTARKPREQRRPNNNNHPHHHHQHAAHSAVQASDYEESDTNVEYHPNTTPHTHTAAAAAAAASVRSNEELNLSVLRRHNPNITSILSLAPYAVIYIFSATTRQWEKSGIEGTLFVCQLSQGSLGEERYSVFVLNRRGLNNFDTPLTDRENVEITEEYVILKVDTEGRESGSGRESAGAAAQGDGGVRIYGLWIYSEPPPNSTAETRTLNAQVIKECAAHAGESLKLAKERQEALRQDGLHVAAAAAAAAAAGGGRGGTGPMDASQRQQQEEDGPGGGGVPMGRQISLKDLFGRQRAQDDEWSVKAHNVGGTGTALNNPYQYPQHIPPPGHAPAETKQDVLGDLFRRAGLAYQGGQG